ncbi:uncharacterized protein BXZ73DRAFT_103127 [Epithele typhae]|uniref:uncharacterized protein n=1 Tax=Epithele typhae TaxID=378194 RepID=UPI002008284C|nr:uncharacterized protein BXZ73DRAFT_103127 [Epithele typhae]KAH9925590.1 hypothetical protein BXZ73DRAFT_103127 [Epithele typhae]
MLTRDDKMTVWAWVVQWIAVINALIPEVSSLSTRSDFAIPVPAFVIDSELFPPDPNGNHLFSSLSSPPSHLADRPAVDSLPAPSSPVTAPVGTQIAPGVACTLVKPYVYASCGSGSVYSVDKPPSVIRKLIHFPSTSNPITTRLRSNTRTSAAAPKALDLPNMDDGHIEKDITADRRGPLSVLSPLLELLLPPIAPPISPNPSAPWNSPISIFLLVFVRPRAKAGGPLGSSRTLASAERAPLPRVHEHAHLELGGCKARPTFRAVLFLPGAE